jgi:NADPH-dependent 2,4-dienoyl-CoA reductase/sulfur reductase-like enzyme
MEAAITAADRGHQVTLYEKSGELGGLLKISDMDKNKYLLHDFKDYLIRQVNKRDIRLLLNTEATPEMVEAENADAVIVASGSSPIIPKIPGVDGENVFTAAEAHCETEKLGQRVAVIGGNLVGCETALYLRDSGRTVTLIEARQAMHIDANPAVGEAIDNRFGDINLLTDSRCVKISPNSVTVEKDGEETVVPADSVVLAVGMRSNSGVYYDMLDCALDVTPVGDCLQVSNVYGATHTAYTAALDI